MHFFICVFLLLASVSPLQAEASSFSDRRPKGLVVTAARGRIAITWEKVKGADYYIVYGKRVRMGAGPRPLKDKNGKSLYKKITSTKKCKTVRRGLKKGRGPVEYDRLEEQLKDIQITPKGIDMLADSKMGERVDQLVKGILNI